MIVKSWMSGLKCVNISRFLKSVAWDLGLEINILERDRGLLRETVYFQLEGNENQLSNFNRIVKKMVEERNK